MARRRMIDPNFWASPDVAKLTHFQRLILIGLFSNADDEGKGFADPHYVKSCLFPYESAKGLPIKASLRCIEEIISIIFYEVNGGQYYKFLHWDKWQRVDKPQYSKIPNPPNSKNDSNNDSKNDSGLKEVEVKGRERKLKEVKKKNPFSLSQIQSQNQLNQKPDPLAVDRLGNLLKPEIDRLKEYYRKKGFDEVKIKELIEKDQQKT